MVKTDLFEELIHFDEPVMVLESNSVYINGIEVKLGECVLNDIKNVQFKIDRIIELIFRPETVIVFVPKGCDVNTAYPTKYRIWIKVIFDALGEYAEIKNKIYSNYTITNEVPTAFDEIIYGLDFGYNNPTACLRIGLKDGNIYILDELYERYKGEMFYKSTEVEVIAHYDKEEYKIVFNSKFPMPEELEDALSDNAERAIFVSKG